MAQRDNILQELNELGSVLTTTSPSAIYHVPTGYFENLSEQIMARIKVLEDWNEQQESALISFLSSKQTPYQVPANYFDGLEKRIMQDVLQSEKVGDPGEELAALSPLLNSLKKENPYQVPSGYFENLDLKKEKKHTEGAKLISLTERRWLRYAAAAVVIGIIAIGVTLFTGRRNIDPTVKSYAWVKNNMKKVSTEDLDKFINTSAEKTPVLASNNPTPEIKELVKNISNKEIQDFLNDIDIAESDPDDLILN